MRIQGTIAALQVPSGIFSNWLSNSYIQFKLMSLGAYALPKNEAR